MQQKTGKFVFSLIAIVVLTTAVVWWPDEKEPPGGVPPLAIQPSLTVRVITPQQTRLPIKISANGNIMAWQEASIGTEANGLRLIEVKVNVGDEVQPGQVLAVFSADSIEAELAQSRAAVAEADATLADAAANAQRARSLRETGALSAQQIQQSLNAERVALARLDAAKAQEQVQTLRIAQTRVVAPDAGVISARTATVGAVVPAGQELFRLIRQGRIEWRAEVTAIDLAKLKPRQMATITPTGGDPIQGQLRMVSPVVDTQTRNGLVYVDLPGDDAVRVGMFARGEFEIGNQEGLTLPQSAVLLRDGFHYVLRVDADSPDHTSSQILQAQVILTEVTLTKVTVGRRAGDRIEILDGIDASAQVVETGGSFLGDGDRVRVIGDAQENTL